MNKMICDRCSIEIKNDDDYAKIKTVHHYYNKYEEYEICNECKKQLDNFLSGDKLL